MDQDIIMSQRELQRVPVLEAVVAKRMTQLEAAQCLDLSTRQVHRLTQAFKQGGPAGLAHRHRGRPSNHRLPAPRRERALALIRERYPDFGPTLACETLAARHAIHVSDETLRQWMRQAGLWAGRRRPRPHRQWRERSACRGHMVQMDGSHHDWLEGRGPKLVVMGYVDDATGTAYARFYPSEDLPAALDSFQRYCRRYGIPHSVYLDKHTIYRSPKTPTLEEQLQGRKPQSQFERALAELGVQVIHANSPQAKGRVERLFRTLQDRLIKELRLAQVTSLRAANHFLPGFLGRYNRRFARPARHTGNLHRRIPLGLRLERILCIKEPRVVANDGTIQVHRQRLQLVPPTRQPLAKQGVVVTLSPHGQRRVLYAQRELRYRVLPGPTSSRPPRPVVEPPRVRRDPRPAPDHPWRQFDYVQRLNAFKRLQNRTVLSWPKADISTLA